MPTCRTKKLCGLRPDKVTLSIVAHGEFAEWLPATGTYDTANAIAHVPVDRLYRDRVVKGLKGEATMNNLSYFLEVTRVDSMLIDERFVVDVKFDDKLSRSLRTGQSVRMRIMLSERKHAMLLPVGGFYSDTRGQWVYVVANSKYAMKRDVRLGRKNTEHFEVLDGLNEGDTVITSTYESFPGHGQEIVLLSDLK